MPTPEPHRHRAVRAGRRHRRARWVIGIVALVLVAVGSAAALAYVRLEGNITASPLFAGTTGDAGTEKADALGHAPINILVIGSDQRVTAQDCHLGGDCGGGADNADVEMVVHVAADRSNATVMSVPRDTVTQLPACRDARRGRSMAAHVGQINATLGYGPGCTVAAVHQLTGIPIDHFVMVDFSGVVTMSDAVGGVSVCVSSNVYDTYSHLKLAKGTHSLEGVAALEFVRSRHAFGDGSDLGRTYAQHMFLSAMVRKLKSAGTLADPATVYSLADAATKALTVDTGLASIPSLIGLANGLNSVPAQRIVFTTMPTVSDPANAARVVPAGSSAALFATIAADQPLTAAPKSTGTATPGVSAGVLSAEQVAVRVRNGGGRTGRAAVITRALVASGFTRATTDRMAAGTASRTTLRYGPGERAAALTVATALGLRPAALQPATTAGVTLVIGTDWPAGVTYPGGSQSASTGTVTASANSTTALTGAHAQTADQSAACAPVSRDRTVLLNHVPMTPAQAYASTPSIPASAP